MIIISSIQENDYNNNSKEREELGKESTKFKIILIETMK